VGESAAPWSGSWVGRLLELRAERNELVGRDADHSLEEFLLADRALVRTGVDLTGEVLPERADPGELSLRDGAAQRAETAGILGGEHLRGDAGRRILTATAGAAITVAAIVPRAGPRASDLTFTVISFGGLRT
jgi:hypothetical protein